MGKRFESSRPESPAESCVVEPYAGVFVHDRADRKNANLAMRCIHLRSDPYVTRVDAAENLRVADLPNPAVPVRRESFAVAANLTGKACRLLRTLAGLGVVTRIRGCALCLEPKRQKR